MMYIILLLVGIPILEIVAVTLSGQWFGFWPTIGMIVATGFVGAFLAKRQGMKAWNEWQTRVQTMDAPGIALISSLFILLAGSLLILPGFMTDLVGFLLLIPAVRRFLTPFVTKWLYKKLKNGQIFAINVKSSKKDY